MPLRELFDRLPPHDPEAEAALLGAMLIDPSVTDEVVQLVPSGEGFYLAAHATIFEALKELHDHRQSGDLVQLKEKLAGKEQLDDVGGVDYLASIVEQTPSAAAAPHYARIIRDKWQLRRLIAASEQTLYDAYHAGERGEDGVRETLDEAEQRVFKITEDASESDEATLQQILLSIFNRIEDEEGRHITGLSTGYHDLDELTSGLQTGELIIVAARPSMGKTALALNLAEQIAFGGQPYAERGPATPVGFFSMEMSREAIVQRMLCSRAGVNAQRLRRNMLQAEDHRRLQLAAAQLADAPIFLDDTPALTAMQLRARARRMVARHEVKCVMIDYLQLMTAPQAGRDGRQNEVSAISRSVKALARELSIPIICLAQLNRSTEQREGHKPRMADLRESGSIEQDADVIALLHREEYYHTQNMEEWQAANPEKVGLAELIIAKQRNGPTDTVKLAWEGATMRFRNHAGYREDGSVASSSSHRGPAGAVEPKAPAASAFGNRPKTGPAEDHRDGGGGNVEERGRVDTGGDDAGDPGVPF